MTLRVIGGDARGRRLQQPPRETTRPLTDRAREALFNILGPGLRDGRVADLFAGSGAVGIEALSRAASHATFVERDREAADVIDANLAMLQYADRATVVVGDALAWPGRVREPFDVVFTMPPQWQGLWGESLRALDAHAVQVLAPDGVVVSQCDPREAKEDADLELVHLERSDQRRYGKVVLTFHRLVGGDEARR
ncbi:16S rRNA (guanine(966)-N(2))-methyltransferase RsmD [cyanobacterium TDX16]|nr:16S rRNA (guanine(966)-N(2))-methyltransferase RsmD [cyanobacterium TDX16]